MFHLARNTPPGGGVATRASAAELSDLFEHSPAMDILRHVVTGPQRTALVSSFGAESVVLLHMLSRIAPDTPVLFVDTRMLFAETLAYQRDLGAALGLSDIRVIRARNLQLAARDRDDTLHRRDVDACCALRKSEPLNAALDGFDGWITGRKRFQGGARQALPVFEDEPGSGRFKVNPLARWDLADIRAYIAAHALPPHPLVARGYPSIGCAPCTSPAGRDEDPRAGRWRDNDKTECGIHFENGRLIRKGA